MPDDCESANALLYDTPMAKDPSNMTPIERKLALMRDVAPSPGNAKLLERLEEVDHVLKLIDHERLDILAIREMHARRLGSTAAPPPPQATPEAVSQTPPEVSMVGHNSGNRTLADLGNIYKTDEASPYFKVKHNSRGNYDNNIRRIIQDFGNEKIADIKSDDIDRFYEKWTNGGQKLAMAHALMTMLRMLVHFGVTGLDDPDCVRLSVILRAKNFPQSKGRGPRMTLEHVQGIIKKAHEKGWHSIALAQAFQFDCELHQVDTIGMWVPHTVPGTATASDGTKKSIYGIVWPEINDLVLTHTTSAGKKLKIDLRKKPLVMAELSRFKKLPKNGNVIIHEQTGLPYQQWTFARLWRLAADEAGVPDNIKNMNSRKAATITEPAPGDVQPQLLN